MKLALFTTCMMVLQWLFILAGLSSLMRVTNAIDSFHMLTRKPGLLSHIFVHPCMEPAGIRPAVLQVSEIVESKCHVY